MTGYAVIAAVKGRLGITTDTSDDDSLEALNDALSRQFEERTGRTFGMGTAAVTRLMVGRGGRYLRLRDPIVSVTSLTIGGVALTAPNYRLRLDNDRAEYWAIERLDADWPTDRATTISVTGVWGDRVATLPDDVREAMNQLLLRTWLDRQAARAGVLGIEDVASGVRAAWSDEVVAQAVNDWQLKPWLWVA